MNEGRKPQIVAFEVNPGDILKETTPEGYEIGRYLVLRRIKEEPYIDPWYQKSIESGNEYEKTIYFVCYVLLVGRNYSSVWSKKTKPGDIYNLSAYEITTIHRWEKTFDSPLTWCDVENDPE